MIGEILSLRTDMERLKGQFGRALQVGPVEIVDAKRGFRLKLGEAAGGEPFLSPWYPHPESGGATSTWAPLSKGQIVGVLNPGGDPRQGILLRGGFSDQNPPPSQDLGENVFAFGGVRLEIKDGGTVIVHASRVELGGVGGKQVARIGDKVNVGSGSSAGLWPIVEGSNTVFAVD